MLSLRIYIFFFQEPYCPPPSPLPDVFLTPSVYQADRLKLFHQQHFTDVILVTGSVGFSAHRYNSTTSLGFNSRELIILTELAAFSP